MVPEGWKQQRFGEIVALANGQVDPKEEPYASMLHIGPENIQSGTGNLSGVKTAKECGVISGKYEFDAEAIVYSKIRPNLNKAAMPGYPGICSADMYPIWGIEGVADTEFLLHLMLSNKFVAATTAVSLRTGMPKINRPDLNAIRVVLPPLAEQRKIADILSTWDRAIETTEALLATARTQKRALMQTLLTGKRRFPEFEGEEWREVKVGDILEVRKERQVPTDEVPLFSLTIEDGVTEKTDRYNREFLVKDTKAKTYKVVQPGDIVFNPANLRWGAINYHRRSHPVVVSPIYEVLYVKDKQRSDLRFVAQALKSGRQIAKFAAMTEGTLMERKAVKIGPFLATKLPLPPTLNEQSRIAQVFDAAEEDITGLTTQIDKLRTEKKALMQQLLTGKRRVVV